MSTVIAQLGAPPSRYPQPTASTSSSARPKTSTNSNSTSASSSRPSSRVTRPSNVQPNNVNIASNNNNTPVLNQPGSSSSKSLERRQVVGQYMFGRTIGEGTFGKVKLAVHMPTGEKVAIKILEKNKIKEASDIRRVNREIKILKKSKHNNIIQLYEVFDTKSSIYLIMECAEGGEIFDFIVTHKHVNEVQSCKFFHQLVDGVNCLHHNNITHRDLKPENLLLKSSKNGWILKIVDFGLSNTHEGDKLLVTACGSPCYAAPEMIAGRKYYGPLADIWSMGVILFALVCGFLPFEDPNTAVLYKKILSGEYKPAKWISNEVKDLIRHILETDPKKRYTLNDIKRHPWYNQISEDDVPKDIISNEEIEKNRNDTLIMLANAGIDPQSVLDGLASNACNSLTAMYYLSEQKIQNRLMNGGGKPTSDMIRVPPDMISANFINGNSSLQNQPANQPRNIAPGPSGVLTHSQKRIVSKPSVQIGEVNNATQAPRSSQIPSSSVQSSKLPASIINTPNIGYSIPTSRITSSTPTKSNQSTSNYSSNTMNTNAPSSAAPKSANGTTRQHQSGNVVAYLQAPSLLRQFQQVKNSTGSKINQSEDTTLIDSSTPANEIPKLGVVKKNNNGLVPTPIVSIKGRSNDMSKPKIPSLNLPSSVMHSSINNDQSVLVSQSARQSSASNHKPSNVPRTARPDVGSTDNSISNSEGSSSRPNTRKNNIRVKNIENDTPKDNENINNSNIIESNNTNLFAQKPVYQLNLTNNMLNNSTGGILTPPPLQPLQAHGIEPKLFQKPATTSSAATPTPTPQQPQAPTPSNNLNQIGVRRGRNIVQVPSSNQENISIPQGLKVMER